MSTWTIWLRALVFMLSIVLLLAGLDLAYAFFKLCEAATKQHDKGEQVPRRALVVGLCVVLVGAVTFASAVAAMSWAVAG